MPVQLDRFCAAVKRKENLQILRGQLFAEKSCETEKIVLTGYVADSDGPKNCVEILNTNQQVVINDLISIIEEADARIIPHVSVAIKTGNKKVVVLANDTDVLVLLLQYYNQFLTMSVQELWIEYSTGDKSRYIPIHTLAQKLGEEFCNTIFKIHVLTGCDSASKVGAKAAALKANYDLLVSFEQDREPRFLAFKKVEKCLCSVLYPKENCDIFDDLRYIIYTKKNKTLSSLRPLLICYMDIFLDHIMSF